jgi:two-component sensor histidine kinase
VEIDWRFEGPDLHILWSESGGPAVTAPARNGFGRILVERVLASDVGGKVSMDFAAAGLKCRIVLPPLRPTGEGTIFPASAIR